MALYNELKHFDSYNSIGTELAIFAAQKKRKIKQFAIKTRDRVDSPRFGRKISANYKIFRALSLSLARHVSVKVSQYVRR
jgi:hypothetical protein